MITPIELHNKQHKAGRGYSRKEMDLFLEEVYSNYEQLYKENADLKEKITQLSDGIQYYKAMETTLQKALVLAEKTSKDTVESANSKAVLIEKEAKLKADSIVNSAYVKAQEIKKQSISLLQQYNQFKAQYKQIAVKQIELLDGEFYEIYSKDLIDAVNEASDISDIDIKSSVEDQTAPDSGSAKDDNADMNVSDSLSSPDSKPEIPTEPASKQEEKQAGAVETELRQDDYMSKLLDSDGARETESRQDDYMSKLLDSDGARETEPRQDDYVSKFLATAGAVEPESRQDDYMSKLLSPDESKKTDLKQEDYLLSEILKPSNFDAPIQPYTSELKRDTREFAPVSMSDTREFAPVGTPEHGMNGANGAAADSGEGEPLDNIFKQLRQDLAEDVASVSGTSPFEFISVGEDSHLLGGE